MKDILKFQNVFYRATSHEFGNLLDVNFSLAAGKVMMVHFYSEFPACCLPDLAQGLMAPDNGDILFQGESWQGMPTWRQGLCRGQMGRVFGAGGWISNLTVRENIILRQRHHTTETEEQILREAEELALIVGLSGLPHERPETVVKPELQRAAWVKAFMGHPRLVILCQPENGVERNSVASLCDLVDRARNEGSSVIWLTLSTHLPRAEWQGKVSQYDLKEGQLKARTGGVHG